jgi:uncharacterized Zn finger protein
MECGKAVNPTLYSLFSAYKGYTMPKRQSNDPWADYGKRIPADGIRAKNQRGDFGQNWWAQRWLAAIEGLGWGSRLTRGRSYARNGSVLNLDVYEGGVRARVQGSQASPYKVSIRLALLSDESWEKVIAAMAEEALFAAKLLAGEMPQEIEQAFETAGVHLFPQNAREIETSCDCPDWANPCKHSAAVYYLLAERFDEDPFLLFAMRGRDRDSVIEALREQRADEGTPATTLLFERPPALADLLAGYYQASTDLAAIEAHIAQPEVEAALLRRYGPPPQGIEFALRKIYKTLSENAIKRLYGE